MRGASILTDGGTGLAAERARSLQHLGLLAGERVLQILAAAAPATLVAVPALPGLDGRHDLELRRATQSECKQLPSGSFDAVVIHEVLERVNDPCACLREAHRLTRPGGRIAVYGRFLPDGFDPPQWIAVGRGPLRGLRASARRFADILSFARIDARLTWDAHGMAGSGFRSFELRSEAGARELDATPRA